MSLRSCVQRCIDGAGPGPDPPRPVQPDNGGDGYQPMPYYPSDDSDYRPFPGDDGYDPYPAPPKPPVPQPSPDSDSKIMKLKNDSCIGKQFPSGYDLQNDTCSFDKTGYKYPCATGGDPYCCRELDVCAGPFPADDLDPRRTWTPKQCMDDPGQGYYACLKKSQ